MITALPVIVKDGTEGTPCMPVRVISNSADGIPCIPVIVKDGTDGTPCVPVIIKDGTDGTPCVAVRIISGCEHYETVTSVAFSVDIPAGAVTAQLMSFGGHSEVANQINNMEDGETTTEGVTTTKSGGLVTTVGTATDSFIYRYDNAAVYSGHLYYVIDLGQSYPISSTDRESFQIYRSDIIDVHTTESSSVNYALGNATADGTGYIRRRCESGNTYNLSGYPSVVDLTVWFGITSASDFTYEMKNTVDTYLTAHHGYIDNSIIHADFRTLNVASSSGLITTSVAIPDGITSLTGYGWSNNTIDITNKKFIREVESESLVDGTLVQTLYDTPIETDISGLLTEALTEPIECEAGGTITFVQADDTQLTVPNTIKYCIEE